MFRSLKLRSGFDAFLLDRVIQVEGLYMRNNIHFDSEFNACEATGKKLV